MSPVIDTLISDWLGGGAGCCGGGGFCASARREAGDARRGITGRFEQDSSWSVLYFRSYSNSRWTVNCGSGNAAGSGASVRVFTSAR